MKSWHENPNEFSPTYVVEVLIESAREDIISHVSVFAGLILYADGHKTLGLFVMAYAVLQFLFAVSRELRVRMSRASQDESLESEAEEK